MPVPFNALKNSESTLYPIAKRKSRKNTDFTGGNRDVELSDKNTDKQNRSDISQRECLILQFAYKKSNSQRQENRNRRVVSQRLYKAIHNLMFFVFFKAIQKQLKLTVPEALR